MSLFIKGMELPKSGEKIIILTSSGYIEDVSGQVIEGVEAVSVPTPHGQLVDAHAAVMLLQKYYDHVGEPLKEHAIGECIMIIKDDVPTVIEAEGSE